MCSEGLTSQTRTQAMNMSGWREETDKQIKKKDGKTGIEKPLKGGLGWRRDRRMGVECNLDRMQTRRGNKHS